MKPSSFRPFATALGATVLAGALAPAASAAANPFTLNELQSGYQLAQAQTTQSTDAKPAEGKCGGEKAGEMKCGGEKTGDGSGEKAGEMKCGEGKCGGTPPATGTEGASSKAGEGKCCGEGKCGAAA
mgnify:CR=1 FL=1